MNRLRVMRGTDKYMLLAISPDGSGKIEASFLDREHCPSCDTPDCCYDCDGSVGAVDDKMTDDIVADRLKYNGFLDGLESLTLALACNGFDVRSDDFINALQTALEAGQKEVG